MIFSMQKCLDANNIKAFCHADEMTDYSRGLGLGRFPILT